MPPTSPIFIPDAKVKVKVLNTQDELDKIIDNAWDGESRFSHQFSPKVEWKLSTKESKLSFLVGIDEVAHFICALPEQVDSVRDAHEILRPSRVPKGSLRQGEFFFVPVEDSRTIDKLNAKVRVKNGGNNAMPLEDFSSHNTVCGVKIGKEVYANVAVFDTRKGRHESLFLPGWHEVVRNTEIEAPRTMNTTYWD